MPQGRAFVGQNARDPHRRFDSQRAVSGIDRLLNSFDLRGPDALAVELFPNFDNEVLLCSRRPHQVSESKLYGPYRAKDLGRRMIFRVADDRNSPAEFPNGLSSANRVHRIIRSLGMNFGPDNANYFSDSRLVNNGYGVHLA